jgi:predicted nucleotidyltransferase
MKAQPAVIGQIAERLSYFPGVEKVILYGSRARGDEEERSDIDLAVTGDLTQEEWHQMQDYVEREARTLLAVELVRLEKVSRNLKENIQREGVTLYERH